MPTNRKLINNNLTSKLTVPANSLLFPVGVVLSLFRESLLCAFADMGISTLNCVCAAPGLSAGVKLLINRVNLCVNDNGSAFLFNALRIVVIFFIHSGPCLNVRIPDTGKTRKKYKSVEIRYILKPKYLGIRCVFFFAIRNKKGAKLILFLISQQKNLLNINFEEVSSLVYIKLI